MPSGLVTDAVKATEKDVNQGDGLLKRRVRINLEIVDDTILEYLRDTRVTVTSQIGAIGRSLFDYDLFFWSIS